MYSPNIRYVVSFLYVFPNIMSGLDIGYTCMEFRINHIYDPGRYHRVHHVPGICRAEFSSPSVTLGLVTFPSMKLCLFLPFRAILTSYSQISQFLPSNVIAVMMEPGWIRRWQIIWWLVCDDKVFNFVFLLVVFPIAVRLGF